MVTLMVAGRRSLDSVVVVREKSIPWRDQPNPFLVLKIHQKAETYFQTRSQENNSSIGQLKDGQNSPELEEVVAETSILF